MNAGRATFFFFIFQKVEEVFMENLKQPDYSDHSKVHKEFALYESFLTQHKYLAGDHVTLAGRSPNKKIKFSATCLQI